MRALFPVVVFCGLSVLFSAIWATFLEGQVYYCSDGIPGGGYLFPGDWVHGDVDVVRELRPSEVVPESDVLVEGWSTGKLWWVWIMMLVAHLGLTVAACLVIGVRNKSA